MAVPSEELYEIVPSESFGDVTPGSSQLQKEIDEIKQALKSAAGLAKVEADAQTIISKMLAMIETSQKLVEQVSSSNQQLAAKVEEALENMNKTNTILSEKLDTILDMFVKASEASSEDSDDAKLLTNLNHSINELVEQNAKILSTLESIERNLKRPPIRPAVPTRPMAQQMRRQPAQAAAPVPSNWPGETPPPGFPEELPPPPFPP